MLLLVEIGDMEGAQRELENRGIPFVDSWNQSHLVQLARENPSFKEACKWYAEEAGIGFVEVIAFLIVPNPRKLIVKRDRGYAVLVEGLG